jgi:hypothetical protein
VSEYLFGNQARSVTSSSRKEVIADVGGLLSVNLRGRSLGIVPAVGCLGYAALMNTRWPYGNSQQSGLYASIAVMGGGYGSIV